MNEKHLKNEWETLSKIRLWLAHIGTVTPLMASVCLWTAMFGGRDFWDVFSSLFAPRSLCTLMLCQVNASVYGHRSKLALHLLNLIRGTKFWLVAICFLISTRLCWGSHVYPIFLWSTTLLPLRPVPWVPPKVDRWQHLTLKALVHA